MEGTEKVLQRLRKKGVENDSFLLLFLYLKGAIKGQTKCYYNSKKFS